MKKNYELKYHSMEENHWWFESRRDIIFNLIKSENRNSKILEIGCSGGPLIKFLKNKGFENIYGIDISKDAINLCKKRGISNVFVMNGIKTKFKDSEFDIIIASDVLEHIKDDNLALLEWNRIIKCKGKLVLFVPAFNFLRSKHDEINKHYRRYTKSNLIDIMKKSNFEVINSSYWNFILFFPIAIVNIFQNNNKEDNSLILNPILNKLFMYSYLLKFENSILKILKFPVGVSVFGIGVKK